MAAQSHTQAGLQLYQSACQASASTAHSREQALAPMMTHQLGFASLSALVGLTMQSLLILTFLFTLVLAFSSVLQRRDLQ